MKLIARLFLLAALALSGTTFAASPTNTYCSSDSGVTWLPCNPAGGGATTSNQGTPNSPNSPANAWTVTPPLLTQNASTALETNHVLKASAGTLYSLAVATPAAAGYLMVFNATSAPSDGAVTPVFCQQIAASTGLTLAWVTPASYSTGITVVYSSTGCLTKTAANAFFMWQVQ